MKNRKKESSKLATPSTRRDLRLASTCGRPLVAKCKGASGAWSALWFGLGRKMRIGWDPREGMAHAISQAGAGPAGYYFWSLLLLIIFTRSKLNEELVSIKENNYNNNAALILWPQRRRAVQKGARQSSPDKGHHRFHVKFSSNSGFRNEHKFACTYPVLAGRQKS